MNKRAIVTGGLGFIGYTFVELLISKKWNVLVVDKMNYPALSDLDVVRDLSRQGVKCEIKDIKDLERIPDCDVIFNFAAESHVGNSIIDAQAFVESNVLCVTHLLSLLIKKPENIRTLPRFIQISTDEVYGSISEGFFTEESLLNPSNPYSASKAAADHMVTSFHKTHGVEYNIIRPTNNWGPRQYHEKLIPIICRHALEGREIRLHDGGRPSRSWLHVRDTCRAILAVYEEGIPNEVYNISGQVRTNFEITRKVLSAMGRVAGVTNGESLLNLGYKRKGQDQRYSVDDSKLVSDTSWRRRLSVDDDSLWDEIAERAVTHGILRW